MKRSFKLWRYGHAERREPRTPGSKPLLLLLLCIFSSAITFSRAALADCSNPAGTAGKILYNGDHHVPQYCDGTNWIAAGPAAYELDDGLLAHWTFDEGSGSTAIDSSGNGYNGSISAGTTRTAGKIGGALSFDGTDDVNIGSAIDVTAGDNFSVTAWFKGPTGVNGTYYILSRFGAFRIGTKDNTVIIEPGCGGDGCWGTLVGNIPVRGGAWHHVAFVSDTSGARIYVDGVLDVTESPSPDIWIDGVGTDMAIGNLAPGGAYVLSGEVDDLRIYDRALSASEVTALYLQGQDISSNLVAHWTFDEDDRSTISADNGSGLCATATGQTFNQWTSASSADCNSNNARASATTNGFRQDYYQDLTWCGYDGMVVDGIEVSMEASSGTGGSSVTADIDLSWDGGTSWTAAKTATRNSTTDSTTTHGGPTDTWGRTWTGAELTDANFRLRLTKGGTAGTAFRVDTLRVKVYFTTPTALDVSGNGNHLDIGCAEGGPSFVTGKLADAVKLNGGINAGVYERQNDGDLDFTDTDDFTFAFWFTRDEINTGNDYMLFRKGGTNDCSANGDPGYAAVIRNSTGNKVTFNLTDGVDAFCAGSNAAFGSTGVWNHAALVIDQDTNVKIYVNGALDNTVSAGLGNINNMTYIYNFVLGAQSDSPSYKGNFDEFRIYDRALSAGEVAAIYSLTAPGCADPAGTEGMMIYNGDHKVWQYCNGTEWVAMAPPSTLSHGLIHYWNFDEGSGTDAFDSVGNADGSLQNGASFTTGYMGTGVVLDGNNDYVSVTADNMPVNNAPQSISMWIKYDSYDTNGAAWVTLQNQSASSMLWLGTDCCTGNYARAHRWGGTTLVETGGIFQTGAWQHVVYTYDGTTHVLYRDGEEVADDTVAPSTGTPDVVAFGFVPVSVDSYFNGYLDEIRMYDRALSEEEVTALYNYRQIDLASGLVGHWALDESGNTNIAVDSSGSGNNGTLTNFPADESANWLAGKINNGLDFDGADDYVNMGTPASLSITGPVSLCIWGKWNSFNADPGAYFFGQVNEGDAAQYAFMTNSAGALLFSQPGGSRYATANGTLLTDNWYHVCAVRSSATNIKIYVDGVEKSTSNIGGSGLSMAQTSFQISSGFPHNAVFDDGRIYDRALSAAEIQALYALPAGPVSACNAAREGAMIYNDDHNVLQYCDGAAWVAIGK